METIIIALVGAGSRSFGPETVRDVLLSEALTQHRINLRLMDVVPDNLSDIGRCAKSLAEKLGRNCEVSTTTSMQAALDGAQFVVTAVEIERKASSATASYSNSQGSFFNRGKRRIRNARHTAPPWRKRSNDVRLCRSRRRSEAP
jgi:Family 4 glycosyl hydrolase